MRGNAGRVRTAFLLVSLLGCLLWTGASELLGDEVRLGTIACDVDADVSADRVVWGDRGQGYWQENAVSSKTFDLLTGYITGDIAHYSNFDDTLVMSRISGDRIASWGYHVADQQAASLQLYDYATLTLLADLPVLVGTADIDGDVAVWSGQWQGAPGECDDFIIDRAGVAYLIACGLAGGEGNVPEGPATPSYSDVPVTHWAYKYVEYVVAESIMSGYDDALFHPEYNLSRDYVAVFVARAAAGGAGNVPGGPATPTFSDVDTDYWAYNHIEYLNTIVTDAAHSTGPLLLFSPLYQAYAFTAASWVEQALGTAVNPCAILPGPNDPTIYAYDAGTAVQREITGAEALPAFPTVSGDWIAWQDLRSGDWDIYLFNVAVSPTDATSIRLTDDAAGQMMPAMSGQRIVWQDSRNGDWDIYLYNIPESPTTTAGVLLTDDPADQMMPAISGDLVAYQDNRNGNWDIYLLDVSTGIETQITDDPADQTDPRIDGRRIVYRDTRAGCAVYLYDLDAVPPSVDFSATPLSGDRPLTVEFTDASSGAPLWWWDWDFGDGETSSGEGWPRFVPDPFHIYENPFGGVYDVTLTVTGIGGTVTLTRPALIEVQEPGYAYVAVKHPKCSELVIEIGCGDPADPVFVKPIWSHSPYYSDVLELTVDLSAFAGYLPPDESSPWWVRVGDESVFNAGQIVGFNIYSYGGWYSYEAVPLPIPDGFGAAVATVTESTPPWTIRQLTQASVGGVAYPPALGTIGSPGGPFDVRDYFPLGDFDYWRYERFDSSQWLYGEYQAYVDGTRDFNGVAASALWLSEWTAEYYTSSAEGGAFYGWYDLWADQVTEYDPPVFVPNWLQVGDFGSQTAGVSVNGEYRGDLPYWYRVAGVEDVVVPAGTFRNCARLEIVLDNTGIAGWGDVGIEAWTGWFAYGVGLVKSEIREVATPAPDLMVASMENPAQAIGSVAFPVTVTTLNFGYATSSATRTGVYASPDAEITTEDMLLGSVQVPALAPGEHNEQTAWVSIAGEGSYYIGACADIDQAVDETREDNNALAGRAVDVVTSPDYVVAELSICSTSAVCPGDAIEVSFTTANQADGGAGESSTTSIYLSPDGTITASDDNIYDDNVPPLPAGGSDSHSCVEMTVPPNIAPGVYYVGAVADRLGVVPEGDENNNTRVGGTVTVASGVVADAGEDKAVLPDKSARLDGSASGGVPPYSYSWSHAWQLDDPDSPQPIASPTETTTYTLTVTDSLAHTATDTVTVMVVSKVFPDVLTDYWAAAWILAAVNAGIVAGYDDGTYRPAEPVKRDQMAAYMSRALAGGEENVPGADAYPEPSFDDVPLDHWAYRYIEYAVAAEVVAGYDDGTYRPEDGVDRGQMAAYVARAKGWVGIDDDMTTAPELFPDVPAGFWSGTAIQACVDNGVVSGYDDGYYRPEAAVTRDQMAVYIARAFDLMP